MAFANTVKTVMPGFGAPTEYVTLLAQNVPINATTSFALTGFNNPIRSFRLRFKTTATGGAATVIGGVKITGTDGSSTVTFYMDLTTRTANEFQDWLFSYISELFLTTVTIAITVTNAGGAATADIELTGNN